MRGAVAMPNLGWVVIEALDTTDFTGVLNIQDCERRSIYEDGRAGSGGHGATGLQPVRSGRQADSRSQCTTGERTHPTMSRGWRRRTGIEPARDRIDPSPVLKTGGPTRRPDASERGRREG